MPYTSWTDVNPAIKGIKPKVTLAQANHIADTADAIDRSTGGNAWGIAIAKFKKEYIVRGGKWMKRKKASERDTYPYDQQELQEKVNRAWHDLVKSSAKLAPFLVDDNDTGENIAADAPPGDDEFSEVTKKVGKKPTPVLESEVEAMDMNPKSEIEVTEAFDSLGGYAERVRRAFYDKFTYDIGYSDDVYRDHATFGNALIVHIRSRSFAVPFTEDGNEFQFSPPNEWREVYSVYIYASEDIEEVNEVLAELFEPEPITISENNPVSQKGRVVRLVEDEGKDPRSPLVMEIEIIQPGWGNKKDNHYYPVEMLREYSPVFEGVKMHVTDHKDRSERTEVSVIDRIVGFSEAGAPRAQVTVFDPDFAEKTRNRAMAGRLETLECSILANGEAKKGSVDGRVGWIVQSIQEAFFVDWVTRAGAGGRAKRLSENSRKEVGEMPTEEKENLENLEETATVTIREGTEEENAAPIVPAQDAPVETQTDTEPETNDATEVTTPPDDEETPTPLTQEQIEAHIATIPDHGLHEVAVEWLKEGLYHSTEEIDNAITRAKERLSKLTPKSRVFGQGDPQIAEANLGEIQTKYDDNFKNIMREVGLEV